jgi:TonB-linked SusC/RagA family outer membrane protein
MKFIKGVYKNWTESSSPYKRISFVWAILGLLLSLSIAGHAQEDQHIPVTGIVTDSAGAGMAGVSVTEKGTANAVVTGNDGKFSIIVAGEKSILHFTSVGYSAYEVKVGKRQHLTVPLVLASKDLGEIVVVGYGTQKKASLTGAISTVTAKDIERVHGGSTVSTTLAGKLPGVTFRQGDGRPGASAGIQIRNMGSALFVIDGIQQDEGQFNNLAPNDVESITVLKDASAAIYGVRAANGVVVVTTKKGTTGRNNINLDAYAGWQNWTRFPRGLTNTYQYLYYRADAEVNSNITEPDPSRRTNITQAVLDAAKLGTDPAYRSFDWRSFIMQNKNAPQNSINLNVNGGNDKVNYYLSGTHFFQNSQEGKEYLFRRTNIQSNVTARLADGLKAGIDVNGRIETRENPGVPGYDDYVLAKQAVLTNTPMERPYANDNPNYLNDLGQHLQTNYAFLNEKLSGLYHSDWRVLQANFHAEYDIPGVKGLSVKGLYSYYIADYVLNNHEYTYNAYTYDPVAKTYNITGGSTNPWREREQIKQMNVNSQFQINYANSFGQHNVKATLVAERTTNERARNWIHASPISNNLPLIYFPTADQYQDSDDKQARLGYIGRLTYNFSNRYFFEASVRRDASYLFAPGFRVGYFPGVSAGWRITDESWAKHLLGDERVLSDLKIRASYGQLGDDRALNGTDPIIAPYSYLAGYNYNQGTVIIDGNPITVSRDKGIPSTRVSWTVSKITDIGMDFAFLNRRITGSFDYFYRKRSGIPGAKNDVVVPQELGYTLPQENVNSDAQYGGEISAAYNGNIGKLLYTVGGNFSISRNKFLHSYRPVFSNSLDQYRNAQENRYTNIGWGYVCIGQFTSMQQIRDYKVDIDGQGNRTLLPGDLIYQDVNGDGKIDGNDQRPIGYGYGTQPNINFGFSIGANYKGWDMHLDFSGAAGYTWYQNWESRWAFQNNGNLNTIFEDRWHRADPLDVNSAWIPGKYPANRYNPGFNHSDYAVQSTFWLHNVKYLRARTLELGYTLPAGLLHKSKIVQKARVYINAYNLFSFDNLKQYNIDPEVIDDNSLQHPQNKVLNVGCNLTF